MEKDVAGTYTEYLFDSDGNPIGENNRSGWTDTDCTGAVVQDELHYPWGKSGRWRA